ncbi:Methylglyoxal synthase [Acholeplasma oculi]|uniref:Methylglyoxal synthase n=1 Tax=Acholeplasma oculi TaxID=35623 RepID=A0A061AJE5_9MOLU|nr:methylglyoxal synthase [Acholeplasma oculi]CDR31112.1 Methylglyoxal synthase [Acholeplasma oculi]SKC37120.1 methylglyoxal synthase [Acholeplasma oculi]SUT90825.1 Methylglyoxal synthase [Acholeplasma oculi]
MKIALIAHDKKKDLIIEFSKLHEAYLKTHQLYATGTTGKKIMEHTNLSVNLKKSGPLGGDQEIGSMIANGKIDMVIFFRDPLTAQPHEPDVSALLRLCDVYNIPLATNPKAAELFLGELKSK